MAYITLNREKLRHNFRFLQRLFRSRGVEWSVVSKLLCGNRLFLEELVRLGVRSMCDSRVVNLKVIKQIDPSIRTIHIRPPALRAIPNIVRYADVSFNTEYRTLQLLSEEAERQHTLHHVVIMIELGERREGVMQHKFVSFYERVRTLPNLRVVGIGTNFACLSGVLPDREKLTKLVRLRDLIRSGSTKRFPIFRAAHRSRFTCCKNGLSRRKSTTSALAKASFSVRTPTTQNRCEACIRTCCASMPPSSS